jgi:hypothetical protein
VAKIHPNVIHRLSTNQLFRQQQLFSLISRLCAPRQDSSKSDVIRLIVDSRIAWASEPIDGNRSWLYVPEATHAKQLAGCTILTVD